MSRREFLTRRQYVFGDGVENAGVLTKEADVEDLLWVTETEMLKLRIETGFLGSEIWDTETC